MHGTYKIPFFGLDRQYQSIRKEILETSDQVYSSGQVLDGPNTAEFERTIAKMCERRYAIAVNSGSQALIFALRSVDLLQREKNKIVIPGQSFVATLNSVIESGFDPSFCDVDRLNGLLDIGSINLPAEDISAVMYVNLFGNVIDYDQLRAYEKIFTDDTVPIIEDAAQSFGAYYKGIPSGKLGDISCLSFDPTKNLPAYGSGGMVLTDNPTVAEAVVNLRDNGKVSDHNITGTNSKMNEVDCAHMLVKLKYFSQWQQRRTAIANYYIDQLKDIVLLPTVSSDVEHCWHKFVLHVHDRYRLSTNLTRLGIETRVHYSTPLHYHTVAYTASYSYTSLPGAEEFAQTCLSLPIYPELTDAEVEAVVDAIRDSLL